jgi:hypothetical protein
MTALTRSFTFLLALGALVASASVVVFETIDDMARRVPLIVRGRVARTVSGWDEGQSRIWTWAEITVTDTVKGKPPQGLLLVRQPGGEVDGLGQFVAGVARFREGEDCVLFLEADPIEKHVWRPTALAAGKVDLVVDRGQTIAVRNTAGLGFAVKGPRKVERVEPIESLGSPEQFLKRIRTAIEGGAR